MRFISWFGSSAHYFAFGAALLFTSSAVVFTGNNFSFSKNPGGKRGGKDTPILIVQAEPRVQSAQSGTAPPNVDPEDDFYIDENGNWIAGTTPPKPEPEPQTSSWCGEKKRKKWRDNNCQEVRCPDFVSGPRVNWYDSCDPCSGDYAHRICAYLDDSDDD